MISTLRATKRDCLTYRCVSDRLVIRMEADDGSWGEETFVRSGA
ncbi:hypothetical protein [Micromonospora coriariae]|nr:hypothetical protein [Micromonospora coriariae]